jgi:CDP-paratose 2-epimerase
MSIVVITGSNGLIGSEAARHFAELGFLIVGIDNDMRQTFFGAEASTAWSRRALERDLGASYEHVGLDIRDREGINTLLARVGKEVELVIHAAAQPSHDWAARDPFTDFDINATGTLNMLEATRRHAPEASFIFCSTNKVYGDRPNSLPLIEQETRYELPEDHAYYDGIREDMSIDASLHSLFGASKVAADVLVQEYGRYFGLRSAVFRGGTLTGPAHSATRLHGFLGYVMRCAVTQTPYVIYGYQGKQVRDAIHSHDLIRAFEHFFRAPRVAEIYNIGGGRASNASVLEALDLAERISGNAVPRSYEEENRVGDHLWWIGSNEAFRSHYPGWEIEYGVERILGEIYEHGVERWTS